MLENKRIGFIGAGNMGESLIKGLLKSKIVNPERIAASDKTKERLAYIAKNYGVKVFTDNSEVVRGSDIIILAVKSSDIKDVIKEIAGDISKDKLLITIAAGVSMDFLRENLPHPVPPIIRAMPNTPSLVLEGAVGIYLSPGISDTDRDIAVKIFETVGKVVLVEKEEWMDAVTGLSGSGPAYMFLIMEALSDAGVKVGLPRNVANLLAIQTMLGSAKLALESKKHFGELKDMVTSPGGTTIAGLHVLEDKGLRGALMDAVEVATKRSEELGKVRE
ncbi:MAG: pyrroline-5-carboxylate reductase [Nitrospinae bacterium]|nr:pyrroline-5-carboxylate reductase [Nitrospinota bacterium]